MTLMSYASCRLSNVRHSTSMPGIFMHSLLLKLLLVLFRAHYYSNSFVFPLWFSITSIFDDHEVVSDFRIYSCCIFYIFFYFYVKCQNLSLSFCHADRVDIRMQLTFLFYLNAVLLSSWVKFWEKNYCIIIFVTCIQHYAVNRLLARSNLEFFILKQIFEQL